MKSLMKLLVTILVVAVIGFIVGYLLMNGAKKNQSISGDAISGELNIEEKSGETFGEIIAVPSGESIENQDENLEENIPEISKEEKIKRIEEQVQLITSGENVNQDLRDKLTLDLVSDSAKDFMKYFKVNELSVTINAKPGLVEIMPDTDFIENMVYYFDENGDLILYESVSTTVEGSCKYYFEKGTGISVVWNYENEIEPKQEYIGDILNRAKLIYEKYGVK
mgnify:CR=1 FL=1